MADPIIRVEVGTAPFDVAAETALLTAGSDDVGAVVSFVGLCRSEGGRLAALELEHYPGMTEAEITRIAREAADRWRLAGVTVIHRVGRLVPGDPIVLALTASAHRAAALEAASFLMDYLKTSAPIWKKEHFADGSPPRWVEPRASDDAALLRWREEPPLRG
ncbi:MAG: molybdenum cofactor biosynthesis protein MoaE [Bauldia sp.]|nr:molybdenum cofactor biosynthesis protein MoaE [Bauldia sp.]